MNSGHNDPRNTWYYTDSNRATIPLHQGKKIWHIYNHMIIDTTHVSSKDKRLDQQKGSRQEPRTQSREQKSRATKKTQQGWGRGRHAKVPTRQEKGVLRIKNESKEYRMSQKLWPLDNINAKFFIMVKSECVARFPILHFKVFFIVVNT